MDPKTSAPTASSPARRLTPQDHSRSKATQPYRATRDALTIARWRVLAIVIGTLWLGSIVLGFLYNLIVL